MTNSKHIALKLLAPALYKIELSRLYTRLRNILPSHPYVTHGFTHDEVQTVPGLMSAIAECRRAIDGAGTI